ncbi:MAG: tetratricopeptide (TPR) repeat protein [Rhodothermales bacterium]|jgi:tetratricopeptide (TPR) repeat protein
MTRFNRNFFALLIVLSFTQIGWGLDALEYQEYLASGWAKISFVTPKKQRKKAFITLCTDAEKASAAHPKSAEIMTWRAIILASFAGEAGPLDALDSIKAAKTILLKAKKRDATALNGAVYTTLGSLYTQAPGWPISFGDKKLGLTYLKKGLEVAPDDIDANYFMADYYVRTGDEAEARKYCRKALAAPARRGRKTADDGRNAAIREEMAEL